MALDRAIVNPRALLKEIIAKAPKSIDQGHLLKWLKIRASIDPSSMQLHCLLPTP